MAELSISEAAPPDSGRFLFRLRSIFILLAIGSITFGLVPLWNRNVIVPECAPWYVNNVNFQQDPSMLSSSQSYFESAESFSGAFSLIAFLACCGIWYSGFAQGNPSFKVAVGCFYGIALGFFAWPRLWCFPFLIGAELTRSGASLIFGDRDFIAIALVCFIEALLLSFWPTIFRRYRVALVLFTYHFVIAWIMTRYAIDIILPGID